MTHWIYLAIESTDHQLWGLTPQQRLQRELGDKVQWLESLTELEAGSQVTMLRGDMLYDTAVLKALMAQERCLLADDQGRRLAVTGMAEDAILLRLWLVENGTEPEGYTTYSLAELDGAVNQMLLKHAPLRVQMLDHKRARQQEQYLFDASYKGITDLVTKWLWPPLAVKAVGFCVKRHIQPNTVTALSWVLAIAAGWLFYQHLFFTGLVLGWFMTFLDTVDGKLARVTVTSSSFGNLFDHVLDLIHPPLWYIAWGAGLLYWQPNATLSTVLMVILIGYIGGRAVEGAFQKIHGFSLFVWQPLDSFNRLITARRNPCLILLTLGWLFGAPDWALWAVALWTAFSTLFLLIRFIQAWLDSKRGKPITSWLTQVDSQPTNSLAVRWFARPPNR